MMFFISLESKILIGNIIFLFRKISHPGNTKIWWTHEPHEIEKTARKEKDADGSCMDIMCIVDRGIHRQSKI